MADSKLKRQAPTDEDDDKRQEGSSAESLANTTVQKKVKMNPKQGTPIPGNSTLDLLRGTIVRDLNNPLNSVRSAHALYGSIFTYARNLIADETVLTQLKLDRLYHQIYNLVLA